MISLPSSYGCCLTICSFRSESDGFQCLSLTQSTGTDQRAIKPKNVSR
jgi:hypothetical protein